MESVVPVQNENFSGDGKEFKKLPGAVGKAESQVHWQFNGNWQILWRSISESSNFYTSSIWDEWYCSKSGAQKQRSDVCCSVVIRLGWKMVGLLFLGMLLLSAKCSRPVGRWEKLSMKGDSENHFQRPSDFSGLPGIFFGCAPIAGEFGKDIFWSRTWRKWRTWTRQKFIFEQNVGKRSRIPRTHSKAGPTSKEWRSQRKTSRLTGRVSNDRNKRWCWSPKRLLTSKSWRVISFCLHFLAADQGRHWRSFMMQEVNLRWKSPMRIRRCGITDVGAKWRSRHILWWDKVIVRFADVMVHVRVRSFVLGTRLHHLWNRFCAHFVWAKSRRTAMHRRCRRSACTVCEHVG